MVKTMNNEQYKNPKALLLFYSKKQIVKAFIVDLYFFIITGGIFIVSFVNIIPMMIRYLIPGLITLYFVLVFISFLGKSFFVETLESYKESKKYIDYLQIKYILTMIYAIIIMAVMIIIFIIL